MTIQKSILKKYRKCLDYAVNALYEHPWEREMLMHFIEHKFGEDSPRGIEMEIILDRAYQTIEDIRYGRL